MPLLLLLGVFGSRHVTDPLVEKHVRRAMADMGIGVCGGSPPKTESPLLGVDPFIGTGGEGFGCAALNPGASVPYGMARVGPDTSLDWLRIQWYFAVVVAGGQLDVLTQLVATGGSLAVTVTAIRTSGRSHTHTWLVLVHLTMATSG